MSDDDLGDVIRRFYTVPGVLGIRGNPWDPDAKIRVRVKRDTPELRALIAKIMQTKPYVVEVAPLSLEQASELDEIMASTTAAALSEQKRAKDLGVPGARWGGAGTANGSSRRRMQLMRTGAGR